MPWALKEFALNTVYVAKTNSVIGFGATFTLYERTPQATRVAKVFSRSRLLYVLTKVYVLARHDSGVLAALRLT